jgi:hypothetical protein
MRKFEIWNYFWESKFLMGWVETYFVNGECFRSLNLVHQFECRLSIKRSHLTKGEN